MKKNNLYNEPFDHERYERDTDWVETLITIALAVSICAIVYYVGSIVMG